MSVSPHQIPTETEQLVVGELEDPKRANANGTIDRYCHILVGERGNFTGTFCGLTLEPAQAYGHEPPPDPCPGGHPSCPDCAEADRGSW